MASMFMKQPFMLVALCGCAICGCGKKDAASAQNKTQPTPEQAAQIEAEYILPENKTASPTRPAAANPNPPAGQSRPNVPQPARLIQERINGAIHAQLT